MTKPNFVYVIYIASTEMAVDRVDLSATFWARFVQMSFTMR